MALPSGIRGVAVRAARIVPDAVLGRVLPDRLGFVDPRSLQTPAIPDTRVRLFIGPVNFAGQGWQWSRAAERLSGVGATSMAYTTGAVYGFPVDQPVPASVYLLSRAWQQSQRVFVSGNYTHVIIEAGRSLFGDVYSESVLGQIRGLQSRGVRVALLTHGSDMRSPARHLRTHAFSPFAPGAWELTEALTVETSRNHALREQAGVPVFASTLGMLDDVPDAWWLPVVIEPERWRTDAPPLRGDVAPLVIHAPSSAVVKGTDLIEPALAGLAAEGIIRYERIQGVPASDVPARFARADIVLDQFRLGDYGVAACEAMAAGRIVVGNVDDHVRRLVSARTGRELPIVQADPSTIADVLRAIVADPAKYRSIAAHSADFAREVHDGRRSAEALLPFLNSGDDDRPLASLDS